MKKNNRTIYILAFCLFALGIGWLCLAGFTENSVYFLNVSEARAAGGKALAKARLFGVVAPNTLNNAVNSVKFDLADKDAASLVLPVSYSGVIPDNFKEGAEVIVEGSLDSSGCFLAKTLMTKCPSKYKKENRQANNRPL